MSAMEPLCHLIGINPKKFSKEELSLLEADLFIRICDEIKEVFKQQYKDFFYLMKFTITKENEMIEKNFIRIILNDILSTEEYTIQGIARYTDTHEDIIHELASGLNTKPLATYLRKVIELHRSVRRELYQAIGKKIASEYLTAA
ncbi:MAG: hypothetical protein A3F12_02325 [Gammaproteobacteria bacterium RIFCSPHIGHO2_12_FULL_38_14]|nr:MAG: hypothetical protein A3F12_02325 [Gammaproteobacteria bacterium RIFCSPHIGHO2_12_FULL_38_14]